MKKISLIKLALLFLVFAAQPARAQTSEFTYQGKLTDTNAAANGQYDFTFRLFDGAVSGTQIGGIFSACNGVIVNGASAVCDNVPVTGGIFTVRLDFGAAAFSDGAERFLEISVRTGASTGAFTPLAPRQAISSAPFSIKSLTAANADNAFNLGGLAASQYVVTNDVRLTDDRNPLPNSPNYIQNTTAPQAASNFNISGSGTVGGTLSGGIVNAATQFNLGGTRAFYISGLANTNTIAGDFAGFQNPTGSFNSFFGAGAGRDTTTGDNNSFFGTGAGNVNQFGKENAFFGRNAGFANIGSYNSFFGSFSGASNTNGTLNSFFGRNSGRSNTTGYRNSFFGVEAGYENTDGYENAFFGVYAGRANTTGNQNTFIGFEAGKANTTGEGNIFIGRTAGSNNTTGSFNILIGYGANIASGNLNNAVAIGSGATATASNTIVLGSSVVTVIVPNRLQPKFLELPSLSSASFSSALCYDPNSNNRIVNCFHSSSIRDLQNVNPFLSGLSIINRLRPVSFNWKADGRADFGLVAEEVAKVEPLLVTSNEKGETQSVKYDRISIILVNAVQAQQQIIERQQNQLDELKKIICELKPEAAICKEK